jgi:hypothetical protein
MMGALGRYVAGAAVLMALGCSDQPSPTGPAPIQSENTPRAAVTGTFATYPSVAAVPAQYSLAVIYDVSPLVYWEGAYANASASMNYYGNYAEQNLSLTTSKEGSTVGSTTAASNDQYFLPGNHHLETTGVGYRVSGTCGHVANLTSRHDAKIVFFIEIQGITEISHLFRTANSAAAQPACARSTCTSTVSNDEPSLGGDFDPYLPNTTTSCDGGAGNGTSSGTQYGVGDYTGGQTVDWKTGRGTGKPSECGDQARVDDICVEYDTGFGWKSLGCGYITTC